MLTVTVLLIPLLMGSHSISAPHRKNPEALDLLTALVFVGVLVALIILIVLVIYMRDLRGIKRRKTQMNMEEIPLKGSFLSFLLSTAVMGVVFWVLFRKGRGSVPVNSTNCTLTNGTAGIANCSVVPPVGPLTGGGNYNTKFLSHPVATHLWLVFLLLVLLGLLYLAYYYLKLARERAEKRRKIERAMEFDRRLNDLGLEGFSEPREAIVEIYRNAVLWLEGLGIPYMESWTHWEHAEHVKYMHEVFVELTRLFEKAKYAPERLSWGDAERALEVYNALRGKARELAGID